MSYREVDGDPTGQIMVREQLAQLADKLVADGLISEIAAQDLPIFSEYFFIDWNNRFCHISGKLAEAYVVQDLLPKRPHWRNQEVTDDSELAFGAHPTLRARSDYLKKVCGGNFELFSAEAKRWGADISNLKPGKAPAKADDKRTKSKSKPGRTANPWFYNDAGAIAERVAIIKGPNGPARAAALAKAAGKTLGGKDLPGATA
jgi:hypothetical protein